MEKSIQELKDLALSAYNKKDYAVARDLFEQCILDLENEGDKLNAAEMKNNLAVVLLELKQPEEALKQVTGTDLLFAEVKDIKRQAMAAANIATSLQALGKNEEALEMFENSADLFKQIGEKDMRSIILKKIADLQLKTGKHFQAMATLDSSYEQKEKRSFKDKILQSFLGSVIKKITRQG